jgi:hypothetical protein
MLKKSLIFSSIVILTAVLLALAGCEGPVGPAGAPGQDGQNGVNGQNGTNGVDGVDGVDGETPEIPEDLEGPEGPEGPAGPGGPAGPAGDIYLSGNVTADDLEVAFAKNETVILQTATGSVDGVVPAGRTLIVVGKTTRVTANATLNVIGTLTIWDGGILNASGIAATSGLVTLVFCLIHSA